MSETIQRLFDDLEEETGSMSGGFDGTLSFKQLVDIGEPVLQEAFERIEQNAGWPLFLLVTIIMRDVPVVPPEDSGKYEQVKKHYIQLGRDKGYLQ